MLVLISSIKILVVGFTMVTLGGCAIGTGILFAGYNVAVSRNPDEYENLYNTSLMAFAFIETFMFLGVILAAFVFVL